MSVVGGKLERHPTWSECEQRVKGTPGSQTRTATIATYVDFTALDLVGVVVEPPRRDPRDAVLPPPLVGG